MQARFRHHILKNVMTKTCLHSSMLLEYVHVLEYEYHWYRYAPSSCQVC